MYSTAFQRVQKSSQHNVYQQTEPRTAQPTLPSLISSRNSNAKQQQQQHLVSENTRIMPHTRSFASLSPHYTDATPKPLTPPSFSSSSRLSPVSAPRHFPHRNRLHYHNDPRSQAQTHSLPYLPTPASRAVPVVRPASSSPSSASTPTPISVGESSNGRRRTEPKSILRQPNTPSASRNNSPARVSGRRVSFASDTKLTDRRAAAAAAVAEEPTTKTKTTAEEAVKNAELDAEVIQMPPEPRQTRRRFRPGRGMKEKKAVPEPVQKQGDDDDDAQLKEERRGRRSLFGIGPRRSAPAAVPSERIGRRKQKKQDATTDSTTTAGTRRRNRTS